ncbi:cupin domain-containing protein [Novosphingobium sp. BL-52-GroH]|uniref:cupin domain-containing protein n=1 Tax=Novosphingobium sp. BL-52-GroH TaxID=3349877 RepID=UPI00384C8353
MADQQRPRFEIFRGAEAPTLDDCACMTYEGETPNLAAAQPRIAEAMAVRGEYADVPYRREGMSLARLWVKSGFPLPLHSHDCDCLYYVVAGSIRMGTESLAAGDVFFVGSEVPYAYTAGPQGAEVLEFRTTDRFNIKVRDKPVAAWEKLASTLCENHERWADEPPPVRIMPDKA